MPGREEPLAAGVDFTQAKTPTKNPSGLLASTARRRLSYAHVPFAIAHRTVRRCAAWPIRRDPTAL